MALVSVIIPTFNRARFLHVSVDSAIAQTYRPLEIVVIDDGSTDDTPATMALLETKVRNAGVTPVFLRKENGGAGAARNHGVRNAHGEFVALLDDDDTWRPEKLEMQVAELQKTGADVCTCLIEKTRPDGTSRLYPRGPERLHVGFDGPAYLRGGRSAHTISLVMRREFYLKVEGYDDRLRTHEDHEFLRRCAHHGTFCAVPRVLGAYYLNDDSLTRVYASWQKQAQLHENSRLALQVLKEKCSRLSNWDESAWRLRAGIELKASLRDLLWHHDFAAARQWITDAQAIIGETPQLRAMRSLYRKRRVMGWLRGLFGLKDPRDKWTD